MARVTFLCASPSAFSMTGSDGSDAAATAVALSDALDVLTPLVEALDIEGSADDALAALADVQAAADALGAAVGAAVVVSVDRDAVPDWNSPAAALRNIINMAQPSYPPPLEE